MAKSEGEYLANEFVLQGRIDINPEIPLELSRKIAGRRFGRIFTGEYRTGEQQNNWRGFSRRIAYTSRRISRDISRSENHPLIGHRRRISGSARGRVPRPSRSCAVCTNTLAFSLVSRTQVTVRPTGPGHRNRTDVRVYRGECSRRLGSERWS